MHDAGSVGDAERRADFGSDVDDLFGIESTTFVEERSQGAPLHEFHDDQIEVVGSGDVVNPHDVGMGESGGGERLGPESLSGSRPRRDRGVQDLDRHSSGQHQIGGGPDRPHAARPDRSVDPVAVGQHRPRCDRSAGHAVR